MAKDFNAGVCSPLSKTNDYTKQIHKTFTEHWKNVKKERQATIDQIDTWLRTSIERLQKYADGQKTAVNQHYNCLRASFNEQYVENLETANEYYGANEAEPFNELYNECQSLTFQLATLELVKYEFEQPEITGLKEPIKTNTPETRNQAKRRRRGNKKNNTGIENTIAAKANSPPDLAASSSMQTDNKQLSEKNPKKKNNPTKSTTDDSIRPGTNVDQLDNKCWVCCMIFPEHISRKDRQQHINEHYTND